PVHVAQCKMGKNKIMIDVKSPFESSSSFIQFPLLLQDYRQQVMVVRPQLVSLDGLFTALPGLRQFPQVCIALRQKLESVSIILFKSKDLPDLDCGRFVTPLVVQGNSLQITLAKSTPFCITAFGNI